jgi:hypothetical protein
MWAYLIALLTSLSADPAAIDAEPPRAAAAVAYAYAALKAEPAADYESAKATGNASTKTDSGK